MDKEFKVAVVIARRQISHIGHNLLDRKALEIADLVIFIIGSSFQSRSPRNPFTWQEREAMLLSTLTDEEKARVICVPVRDYYNNAKWNAEVTRIVHEYSDQRVALVGYKKEGDYSTYYLDNFPSWKSIKIESTTSIDASELRKVYFEAENMDVSLSVIEDYVLPPVRQYLKAWSLRKEYGELVKEYNKIKEDHAPFKDLPYDVFFTTGDAVVRVNDHVLLGVRKNYPGKGLFCIPGGFVKKNEHTITGALRELKEETMIGLFDSELMEGLKQSEVFGWPTRSCRIDRIFTHAYFFDLIRKTFPSIKAADDLEKVMWVHVNELAGTEDKFFDDHFHILNFFIKFLK